MFGLIHLFGDGALPAPVRGRNATQLAFTWFVFLTGGESRDRSFPVAGVADPPAELSSATLGSTLMFRTGLTRILLDSLSTSCLIVNPVQGDPTIFDKGFSPIRRPKTFMRASMQTKWASPIKKEKKKKERGRERGDLGKIELQWSTMSGETFQ